MDEEHLTRQKWRLLKATLDVRGPALEELVDPVTRGNPESPLRWMCRSTVVLSGVLFKQHGTRIRRSPSCFARGYSLQARNKSVGGAQHPERDAQFQYINAKA